MTLKYKGRNIKLKEAVKKANRILKSDKFYNEIKEHKKFDNTGLISSKIADFITVFKRIISINSLINEYIYTVGYGNHSLEFTHVDNSNRKGKEGNTVPCAIENMAYEMV